MQDDIWSGLVMVLAAALLINALLLAAGIVAWLIERRCWNDAGKRAKIPDMLSVRRPLEHQCRTPGPEEVHMPGLRGPAGCPGAARRPEEKRKEA